MLGKLLDDAENDAALKPHSKRPHTRIGGLRP